jgi:hypothetical protein
MFALSDSQLRTIWNAADGLPAKKRGVFLERIVAWLQFRGGRFINRDFDDAVASRRSWSWRRRTRDRNWPADCGAIHRNGGLRE